MCARLAPAPQYLPCLLAALVRANSSGKPGFSFTRLPDLSSQVHRSPQPAAPAYSSSDWMKTDRLKCTITERWDSALERWWRGPVQSPS